MGARHPGPQQRKRDVVSAALVLLWRLATGQHMDGKRRSDASFFRDGSGGDPHWFSRNGMPSWWAMLAGYKRAAVRWSFALGIAGLVLARPVTEWSFAFVFGPLAGFYLARCVRKLQLWEHYRVKVRPLGYALVPVLGQPVTDVRSWLHVPVDYATNPEAEIVIDVGDEFTGADREMEDVTRAVTAKLGFPNPEAERKLGGRAPCLVYRHQDPPPAAVSLEDIRQHIYAAGPSEVILGLARKSQVTALDMDSETPHAGVSMTTGCGKSELAKNMAAQLAYHGAVLMILDYKLVSHMWAEGLPNVCYARTPAEIHQALMWLAWDEVDDDGNVLWPSELTRRKQVVLAAARAGEQVNLPRLFVIAEERNATSRVLKRHWRRTGGKGPSPALEALDETGETGRQINVNILYIAQRLSAKASGSDGTADARENIGAIITKDPTEATWKMLAGGHAQPPKSGHPGRYQLITRSGVTEYQGVLYDRDPVASDRLARELAMAGTVGEPRSDMPFVSRPEPLVPAGAGQEASARQEVSEQRFVVGQAPSVLPAGSGAGRAVTIAEAVAAGIFVSKAAGRKAVQRRKWTPVVEDPVGGHKYAVKDLHEYTQTRGKR